jgi:hypothetical protein
MQRGDLFYEKLDKLYLVMQMLSRENFPLFSETYFGFAGAGAILSLEV